MPNQNRYSVNVRFISNMRLNLLFIVLQFVHLKPAQNLQKPKEKHADGKKSHFTVNVVIS